VPRTIHRAIKQTKPFGSIEDEVHVALHYVASRFLERMSQLLKTEARVTVSQYNVLRILRGAHPMRLPSSEISNRMVARDPDITRLVDRLAARGLVDRERNDRDRRVVEVGITKQGLALLKKLDPSMADLPKALLGHLGAEKLEQLADLLDAVLRNPAHGTPN
jgi:DNA-binding MarR family transcriptional regulator